MTDESQQDHCASRRCVLLGVGVLGATGVLTACSTTTVPYDANDAGQAPEPSAAGSTANGMAANSTAMASSASSASASTTGTVLGMASAIPVGGGVAYTTAKVVVTQPTKGVYKGFSAVCTHVGCICNQVADGTINCPCHGSKFNITTGAVEAGPAPSPLPTVPVTVTADGKVVLT
jgi:Rieske Fe-S protein